MDPYKVLGLNAKATADEVKQAYRRLAMKHHPDRGGSAEKFQEIQSAYDRIQAGDTEPDLKHFHWGKGSDKFEDIRDIFRRSFGDNFQEQYIRNPDITVRVKCTLKEANNGFTKNVQFLVPREGQKTKTVDFPAGSYQGIRIRYSGEGARLTQSAAPGDLYCELDVEPHAFWKPDFKTKTLECEATISIKDAMIGTTLFVTDINDQEIMVSVPAGTQSGSRLRLRGRGLSKFRENGTGDAYIKINVIIPGLTKDDLNKRLIDILT